MIQTVRKNMEGFTKREVQAANAARLSQSILGHPSDSQFVKMVSAPSGIANVPTTLASIANANIINGKDLGSVRGKTIREKPERARGGECINPPRILHIPPIHNIDCRRDVCEPSAVLGYFL